MECLIPGMGELGKRHFPWHVVEMLGSCISGSFPRVTPEWPIHKQRGSVPGIIHIPEHSQARVFLNVLNYPS